MFNYYKKNRVNINIVGEQMYRISVQKRTFPLLNVLIVRTLFILHHLPSSPPSCNVQPRPTGPTPCSFFIWFFLIFVYNWSNLVKYTYKQMLNSSFLLLVLLVLSSFSRWTVPHIWSGSWRWVSKLPIMILRCCYCFFFKCTTNKNVVYSKLNIRRMAYKNMLN